MQVVFIKIIDCNFYFYRMRIRFVFAIALSFVFIEKFRNITNSMYSSRNISRKSIIEFVNNDHEQIFLSCEIYEQFSLILFVINEKLELMLYNNEIYSWYVFRVLFACDFTKASLMIFFIISNFVSASFTFSFKSISLFLIHFEMFTILSHFKKSNCWIKDSNILNDKSLFYKNVLIKCLQFIQWQYVQNMYE